MMRLPRQLRAGVFGLMAMAGLSVASAAHADSGTINLTIYKAGWFIGGSGGGGSLYFHGRRYPLSVGGVSAGLVFGASKAHLSGWVDNIRQPSDVAGVYGAAGAGAALGVGGRAILLSNSKGARLHLQGGQVGLMVNVDLSGMAISLK
jgi:hypothetical protein